ncbi:MAG: MBL fold metallo-hydrolase [Syntrophomonadaceae bacterium]|jgi:glyoxylase-like metal-dependent hydrolase (beta-lactamase superfamily II)|nr:MBL fold metallo-hydrolase [Syntrophomonadaceae bacterium]
MALFIPRCYGINNSLILVDTGFPRQTQQLREAIEKTGFSAERLTAIILTYQDIDHIGCAADLLKLAPSAAIMAHRDGSAEQNLGEAGGI